MADSYTELPYIFDLLYDVKSVEALHDHLTGRCRLSTDGTDAELIALSREEGIPLPDGLIESPGTSTPRDANAMELLKLIHAQAQRGTVDIAWLLLATSEVLAKNGIVVPE